MKTTLAVTALLTVHAVGGGQQRPVVAGAPLQLAAFEDYRVPVGRLENGVLRITLDAGAAAWQPWGKNRPAVHANVFAADGAPPRMRLCAGDATAS